MGLSLWLVPAPNDAQRLRRIMDIRPPNPPSPLAPHSYPVFPPHITLASLPAPPPHLSRIIPPATPAIAVQFDGVEAGEHYFRSTYIAVRPGAALLALHAAIHANLAAAPRTPKFPHLSLTYIADEDVEERRRWLEALRAAGRVRESGHGDDGAVALQCAEAWQEDDWMAGALCSEIWVVSCEGPVESWAVQEKIVLQ